MTRDRTKEDRRAARNQRLRIHYLLEPGWKADAAIQGLGRTNRTNQAQPPLFRPIASDVKAEKRFLYELNTVAGEQTIKASRFALIYCDVAVIAHTNEYEYNSYFSNKENEAMIDRIFVVKVPYNLRVGDEVRIYEKLIGQSDVQDTGADLDLSHFHIAPYTLRVASMFAILTRLKPSKKASLNLLTKMKLYDGEKQVGDWDQRHVREPGTKVMAQRCH